MAAKRARAAEAKGIEKGSLKAAAKATKAVVKAVKAAATFARGVALCSKYSRKSDPEEGRRLIETLIKEHGDTKYPEMAKPFLFEIDNLQVGKAPPDFESEDLDGRKFKLSEYRGKVVVLDFWGFW